MKFKLQRVLVGAAIGAATGALVGSMTDVGISDDFIKSVRDEVTPGTSALFLMSQNAVVDRVRSAFAETHAQLIRTNLSDEQEAKLREAFGEEELPAIRSAYAASSLPCPSRAFPPRHWGGKTLLRSFTVVLEELSLRDPARAIGILQ
jgi:hypothetical protein